MTRLHATATAIPTATPASTFRTCGRPPPPRQQRQRGVEGRGGRRVAAGERRPERRRRRVDRRPGPVDDPLDGVRDERVADRDDDQEDGDPPARHAGSSRSIPTTTAITITPWVEASRLIAGQDVVAERRTCAACAQRAAAASRSESASLRRTSRASRDDDHAAPRNTSSASVSASPVSHLGVEPALDEAAGRGCARGSPRPPRPPRRRSLTRRSTAAEARHAAAPAAVAMISSRATGSIGLNPISGVCPTAYAGNIAESWQREHSTAVGREQAPAASHRRGRPRRRRPRVPAVAARDA